MRTSQLKFGDWRDYKSIIHNDLQPGYNLDCMKIFPEKVKIFLSNYKNNLIEKKFNFWYEILLIFLEKNSKGQTCCKAGTENYEKNCGRIRKL